jgi:hypothetical protein
MALLSARAAVFIADVNVAQAANCKENEWGEIVEKSVV